MGKTHALTETPKTKGREEGQGVAGGNGVRAWRVGAGWHQSHWLAQGLREGAGGWGGGG